MEFNQAALQEAVERRLLIDRFDSWIFETIKPHIGQRVLEIGCGAGNLTGHLLDREQVVALDLSATNVRTVSDRFAEYPNVRAVVGDGADDSLLELRNYRFDTIVSLNVLEHIEDDARTLRLWQQLLTPGGTLVLIVPAHQRLYGTMDSSIGHYRRYNLADVSSKFGAAGLRMRFGRYMNPVGAFGWFVNGRILKREVAPAGQLKLFNSLVPVITGIDGMLRWPFGLSVLSIGEAVGASAANPGSSSRERQLSLIG